MEQQHLIQKYIFDVDFDSEDKAYQFQNQLAAYIKEKVVAVTDEVFSEVSPKHSIGINKLTIDLGEVKLENFESQLAQLIKTKLHEKLQMLVSGTLTGLPEEQVVVISQVESELSVIEYFFRNGTLPWSVRKNDPEFSIQKILHKYIQENPSEIKRIILLLIPKEEVKLRIIRQLEDVVLWKILEVWAEVETPKIKIFYADLIKVFLKKPILKSYFTEYRELIWKFFFTEVVLLRKHKQALPIISNDFFVYASNEIQRPFNEVVKGFYMILLEEKATKEKISSYQSALPEIVKALVDNTAKEEKNIRPSVEPMLIDSKVASKEFEVYRQQQAKAKEEFLIRFFNVISLVSDKEELQAAIEKAEAIIQEYVTVNPVILKKAIKSFAVHVKELRGQSIFDIFSPEIKKILIKEIEIIENKKFEVLQLEASEKAVQVFLKTAYLPYTILPLSYEEKEFEKVIKLVFQQQKEKLHKWIEEYTMSTPDLVFKKVQIQKYLSLPTIKKYFPAEFLEKKSSAKKSEVVLIKLSSINTADKFIAILREYVKEKALSEKVEYTLAQAIEKFYSAHKPEAITFFKTLQQAEFEFLEKEIAPSIAKVVLEQRREISRSVKEVKETAQEPKVKTSETQGQEEKKPFRKLESGEPVYINNAGLVIFHPYLNRFFKMFDLLDKKEFKDEFSAHKAAHLLQYLVNKGLNCEEHEMILNKLLCGIDLQVPLLREIEITEEEKNICEGLIEGVIQNWTILKKTSNDNFRASFVIREGRLMQEGRDWRLKVEERGYDILVEKLPWSVSMVKLPWMNHMINVEWK